MVWLPPAIIDISDSLRGAPPARYRFQVLCGIFYFRRNAPTGNSCPVQAYLLRQYIPHQNIVLHYQQKRAGEDPRRGRLFLREQDLSASPWAASFVSFLPKQERHPPEALALRKTENAIQIVPPPAGNGTADDKSTSGRIWHPRVVSLALRAIHLQSAPTFNPV